MADLLGVNRGTLSRWLEVEDCPYLSRPDVPGGPWELSAPAVIEWYAARRERQAIEKIAAAGPDRTLEQELDPSLIDIDEAKRRKAVADAMIREIDLDRAAGLVVPIADVAEAVSREYAAVREKLMALGPRIAPRVVGQTEAAVVADEVRRVVDEALRELKADSDASPPETP